ncbi:pentapeptide repeat-containing protein [Klebsiella pneumoniae]|nr:pentapeptide repeat-containing protein [Klebsiella pneumoniae]
MANFSNANCYGIEFRACDLKGAKLFPNKLCPSSE